MPARLRGWQPKSGKLAPRYPSFEHLLERAALTHQPPDSFIALAIPACFECDHTKTKTAVNLSLNLGSRRRVTPSARDDEDEDMSLLALVADESTGVYWLADYVARSRPVHCRLGGERAGAGVM